MVKDPKTALLVIDVQFGPMWGTYRKEETLGVIHQMIEKAISEQIPIFYVQHESQQGEPMARGSQFWQFIEGITPRSSDVIIHKQATDAFYETILQEELDRGGITHLVVVGAQTQFCVDTTCRAAISRGFQVTLVEDGHTTVDGLLPAEQIINHHNHNLSTVGTPKSRIQVVPSNKIVL
ncbi:cysteine hydrolase family protein [Brevibacillus ginsengisoli]|uniref:cysteine hydrolase family protein n=1 Tax=Brevibacillus ginsengisoli TaxID=363854 RepID=UPI003CF13D3F